MAQAWRGSKVHTHYVNSWRESQEVVSATQWQERRTVDNCDINIIMGLSLWIVPNEDEAEKLWAVSNIRSKDPALSAASYPKFYPHITLASLPLELENDLPLIEDSIPKPAKPLLCNFSAVDVGEHYFRSVYVAIEPSSDLLSLHHEVHINLGVEPRTPSFPHMSLCYITDEDAANGERKRYYNNLETHSILGGKEEDSGHIYFNCGSDRVKHFGAHEVWLVRAEGPVERWDILRKFSLK